MLLVHSTPLLSTLLLLLTLVIFAIDALTPLDIAIAVMYVVVVLLSASVWRRRGVLLSAGTCMALTLVAYEMSHNVSFSGTAFGRMLVSLAAIGITAFLALRGQAATRALLEREQALRRSEAFLAGTQRISHTGSFSFMAATGAMYWSDEAARIYGYEQHETPTIERLLARAMPEDRALVRAAIDQTLRGDGPMEVRHRLRLPDGTIRYVHVRAHPSRNQQGECEYLGALMDVTAAALAEQALHSSQAQLAHVTRITTLGELAASIAHEVNQPLAAVSANGEAALRWLDRAVPDLGEARAALLRIREASLRAAEVIQRIRALARRGDPRYVPLAFNAVLEEVLVLLQRELNNHAVTVRLVLADGLPTVCADRVQLQQVIINLLMNGMQAMASCAPGTAVLQLTTEHGEQGGVCFSVADAGHGIAPDALPRLFEAFFTTKADGMGMGLPICRGIIENHGGRIWAHSTPPDGATLLFWLPPMPAPGSPGAPDQCGHADGAPA
jgi:PAS domain S-box-containing protein